MWHRNCPSADVLLEAVSIPRERGLYASLKLRWHTFRCLPCQEKLSRFKTTWDSYFQPEPEVASSILRVYSRLQRDETLILKGWKLGDPRVQRPSGWDVFLRSWGFPTAVAVSLGLLVVSLAPLYLQSDEPQVVQLQRPQMPRSPIRVREGNSVKVHYVQPELLHSVEFETGRAR